MAHHFVRDGQLDVDPLVAELDRFLKHLLGAIQLDLRYDIHRAPAPPAVAADQTPPEVLVVFSGDDQDLLLERHAELLQAIEYLAHRWLWLDPRFYDHVRMDCGDYRALRIEELRLSARVAAQRVRETRQPFPLNPMPPRERRIVHLALKDVPGVRTLSEGTGDHRQVVIYPAETKS